MILGFYSIDRETVHLDTEKRQESSALERKEKLPTNNVRRHSPARANTVFTSNTSKIRDTGKKMSELSRTNTHKQHYELELVPKGFPKISFSGQGPNKDLESCWDGLFFLAKPPF